MIFITHDLSLLVELADEIVVMYAGRLVERASARELHDAPRHPYTLGLLHSFPPMHGERHELVGIPGAPPDLSDLPSGCAFHPRCPYAMARCSTDRPPFELKGKIATLRAGCTSMRCTRRSPWNFSCGADKPRWSGRGDVSDVSAPVSELEARHLTRYFTIRAPGHLLGAKKIVRAVEDVSLDLRAGQVTAVVGESGSGKSVLARLLAESSPPRPAN